MSRKKKPLPKDAKPGLLKGFKQSTHEKGLPKNIKLDEYLKAIRPGKRLSINGKVYYEKRANRSDRENLKYPYL